MKLESGGLIAVGTPAATSITQGLGASIMGGPNGGPMTASSSVLKQSDRSQANSTGARGDVEPFLGNAGIIKPLRGGSAFLGIILFSLAYVRLLYGKYSCTWKLYYLCLDLIESV